MPEGDTIHKIAGFLAPRLEQRFVQALHMADRAARRCAGSRVDAVYAHGKHLFVCFDNRLAVRSHLGMHGSWHFYPAGAEWKKPRRQASLVLAVDGYDYVCFNPKEVSLVATPGVSEHIARARLGPDLVNARLPAATLVARARELADADALIADVLLDQRIAAGIGNVYKSEVLFIERLLPQRRARDVADDDLARCFDTAADLLSRNLGGGKRVTRFVRDGAGRLWAYRRRNMPCLRCDGRIRYTRLGTHHRGTYWCGDCQH